MADALGLLRTEERPRAIRCADADEVLKDNRSALLEALGGIKGNGEPGRHLGFVGLGRMGGPMVGRLLDAGHAVTVFDIDEAAVRPLVARGAAPAGSAAEVASAAEIVLTSLPTPDTVHRVALGEAGIAQGPRVTIVIDLSTTGPSTATRVAEGLGARGIQWVDAPVSGGDQGRA